MSKPKIDRNEAPEGYRAYRLHGTKGYGCTDCAFYIPASGGHGGTCTTPTSCYGSSRVDGVSVIFKKKGTP